MPIHRRNSLWRPHAIYVVLFLGLLARSQAAQVILHLKNGDRLTGTIVSESTNSVTLATSFFGNVPVPVGEITRRDSVAELAQTNSLPGASSSATNTAEIKPAPPKKPALSPANPEAAAIASTPRYWKHDVRFGLNTRYATKDSHEILLLGKSSYARPPFRHIFDGGLKYGKIEGVVSANSLTGSEKTEYQLSPKTYLFSLVGAGYDEVRRIDAQVEVGPGFGMELLKLTNFVWKGEAGFNFQQQYFSDNRENTAYSVRIAEIFAWRVWDKLTADLKFEFFPNLGELGEYRLRLESNLRYPVSDRLSLNLDLIDIYDTQPAREVSPNDLQIRSTIGINF
jgi:hypothetical protein